MMQHDAVYDIHGEFLYLQLCRGISPPTGCYLNNGNTPTYQRDPNNKRGMDRLRRDDGSWSIFPIILGALLLLGLGYYALSDRDGPNRTTTTTNQTNAPGTIKTPSPTNK